MRLINHPLHPVASTDRRGSRVRPTPFIAAGALVAGALLGLGGDALAQSAAVDGEFNVQRFDPAPGPRNFLTTRGARVSGHMAWSAGLMANYQYKPFVIRSCAGIEDCGAPSGVGGGATSPLARGDDLNVVENFATADVMGSLTLVDRLQIGLRVPVNYSEGDGIADGGVPAQFSGVGVGDAMLELKARAYGDPGDTLVLGGALFATAPLGTLTSEGSYMGDASPTVGLRGIFDGQEGPFSFGANLAGVYRSGNRVGSTELGPEFRYGIAGGFAASPVVRLIVDGFGGTKFSAQNGTNSLEVGAAAQITPLGAKWSITVGGGTGVIEGVGVPLARGILGFMWVDEIADRDGDGIADDVDQCPTEAEDFDGFEDADGCPDPDNDGDTIPDKGDKCPNDPEDWDGFEDADGCPEPDNDGDGIDDEHDACPNEPETFNDYQDADGCPDVPDRDNDGVPDDVDQCPDDPEDTDGFQDVDGCPDPDNDGDGIPDELDECVDEPETFNDYQDADGCPDTKP
jgi:OmpA-OmpF porin, OOP family